MISVLRTSVGFCALCGGVLLTLSPAYGQSVAPLEQQLNMQRHNFNQAKVAETADELFAAGVTAWDAGDADTAIAAWQEAVELYSALGNRSQVELINAALMKPLVQSERYEDAIAILQQRLIVAEDRGDISGQIYGLNNLGMLHAQRGSLAQAQTIFADALQLARDQRDVTGIGLALSNLGLAAQRLGDLDSARRYYEAATNYRLQAGDEIGLAHSSNSLGHVYRQLGEDGKALGAYLMARRTAMTIDHMPTLLTAVDGLVNVYSDRGEAAQLEAYITERAALTATDAPLEQQIGLFVGVGKYYEEIGETEQAAAAYHRAYAIAEQIEDPRQQAYVFNRFQRLTTTPAE